MISSNGSLGAPRPVILASASPRRRDLLAHLNLSFTVEPAAIDEVLDARMSIPDAVADLAERKARAVIGREREALILGADTVVVVDDRIFGKPTDAVDAARMLSELAGRWHEVVTGIAVVDQRTGAATQRYVISRIRMRDLSTDEIDAYVATGEPLDKAGAYGIQGLAAPFIAALDGCYTNVVGLPLCETARLLTASGLEVADRDTICRLPAGDLCPRLRPSYRAQG